MSTPCGQKVLRPERCVIFDGQPCAACTEDMELEKETKALEIRLKEILIRRRAVRTAMNENHDRLIHKFPLEISTQIFIQSAPPSGLFDKDERSTPIYLGAVCQKWRQLAWATPQLWSSSLIGFRGKGRYSSSSGSDLPQLVAEWLERSANLPLTIKFDHPAGEDHEDGVYHDVIDILNKHSERWFDVHFNLPPRMLHRLHGSSQGNILRRLGLTNSRLLTGGSKFSTFSMKSKPTPTELTLVGIDLPHVDIISNNLTVASLECLAIGDCFELIRQAPLLESLSLRRILYSYFHLPCDRIVLPHLRSLELSKIQDGIVVGDILDSLSLPSLVQWIHGQPSLPLDIMVALIEDFSSPLKIFKIAIDRLDYHGFTTLLSPLTSLEFLELRNCTRRPTDALFETISTSFESPLFLPQLQSLEFTVPVSSPLWKCVLQIFALTHRRSLMVKVNAQSGYRSYRFEDGTLKRLLELVDKGFDLRVVGDGNTDLLQKYSEEQHS